MAGIYIHIPFCKQKCHYCDFHFSTSLKNQNQLIDAICKELSMQNHFFKKGKVNTIYLGGGTPSLLTNQQIEKIFNTIQRHYNTTNNTSLLKVILQISGGCGSKLILNIDVFLVPIRIIWLLVNLKSQKFGINFKKDIVKIFS